MVLGQQSRSDSFQPVFLQVTIIDTGVRGMIAVGLVPKLYDLDQQPGWLQHSVGFHADDGKYVTSTAD